MKSFNVLIFMLLLTLTTIFGSASSYASGLQKEIVIKSWEMSWVQESQEQKSQSKDITTKKKEEWFTVQSGQQPAVPKNVNAAWVKIKLPKIEAVRTGLYIKEIAGQNLHAYINGEEIYSSERKYADYRRNFLVPLIQNDSNKELTLFIDKGQTQKLSISEPLVGNFSELNQKKWKNTLFDLILGGTLLFVSAIMLFCLFFLDKFMKKLWGSLNILTVSLGLAIISSAMKPHADDQSFGLVWNIMFDQGSNIFIVSFFIYFSFVFRKNSHTLMNIMAKTGIISVIISSISSLLNLATEDMYFRYYYNFFTMFWFLMLLLIIIVMIIVLVKEILRKNNDAIIISYGGLSFFLFCTVEMIWFFFKGERLYVWKWGTLPFVLSFIYVIVRMIYLNFLKLDDYARQLEIFNVELQKSGKMEMVSQLAASIAHEVRNPLQVTRGFLQLIGNKNIHEKDKQYMSLAIKELDRAGEIINEFLSFAKPQADESSILNIGVELKHVHAILTPLLKDKNSYIDIKVDEGLFIEGNSSKFKQALINILKNSIESLIKEGRIEILGYQKQRDVIIQIIDNGIGMSEEELLQIGQPYYSNKENGTGLGVMVTTKIIHSMGGEIQYNSWKDKGTQVTLTFPLYSETGKAQLAMA